MSKTLVAFYSAQNHTREIAEKIAKYLNADIFEIAPEEVYSDADLDWTDNNSRVCKEYHNEISRDIKLKENTVSNWKDYDTIIIAYPIWWAIAAWPVDTFVKANDFTGKKVIPVATSYSSGLGDSAKLLKDEANGGDWVNATRFFQSPSDKELENWTKEIQ